MPGIGILRVVEIKPGIYRFLYSVLEDTTERHGILPAEEMKIPALEASTKIENRRLRLGYKLGTPDVRVIRKSYRGATTETREETTPKGKKKKRRRRVKPSSAVPGNPIEPLEPKGHGKWIVGGALAVGALALAGAALGRRRRRRPFGRS